MTLVNSADGSAVNDIDGNPVAPVTTLDDGLYSFTNLDAGNYKVIFSNVPTDKQLVAQDAGNDDAVDSDAEVEGTTHVIQSIELDYGENSTDNDADHSVTLVALVLLVAFTFFILR